MAPVGERLAALETEVQVVKAVTAETRRDVKALLQWRDEERGARETERAFREAHDARMSNRAKGVGIFLTILTIGLNVLFRVVG